MIIRERAVWLRSFMRRQGLKRDYRQGKGEVNRPENIDESLIQLGAKYRKRALDQASDMAQHSQYRFLLCTPQSMAAAVWFEDLADGMRVLGIPHLQLDPDSELSEEIIHDFMPNVVVALDQDRALENIDLRALVKYKNDHGCLRLFIPTRYDLFKPKSSLKQSDATRLSLAKKGQTADCYFSLYDEQLYDQHYHPWSEAGFPYLSLPQACNPIHDYPRPIQKTQDWIFVGVNNPSREACMWRTVRPILQNHCGRWAGTGWGFGDKKIPSNEMATFYSSTKIALAPLISFLRENPAELSHRVFEAAACGSFQITSQTPITDKFFSQKALVCSPSPERFADTYLKWINRPQERARVVEQALIEVYDKHTIFHRIQKLMLFIEQQSSRF